MTTRRAAGIAVLLALGAPGAAPGGPVEDGERLAKVNCARCHVISPENRMGGIGSTPSFMVLRTFDDWEARFAAFWTLRPHGSFTQIEGVTEPFRAASPPPIHPLSLTLDDVDDITAYARSVAPADLGPPLQMGGPLR